jgi:very-short-patch-repair endonuclease
MRTLALTGPAAAALHGLDGFRDLEWAPMWCAPAHERSTPGVIRTRLWTPPHDVDGIPVVPPRTAIRHLHTVGVIDGISQLDRVEFAAEHVLRNGASPLSLAAGGGAQPGDSVLRAVLRRRTPSDPPTESYAETRAAQRLRGAQIQAWRQVAILGGRRRADFGLPFQRRRRPELITPMDCALLEIDSSKHHKDNFEDDHDRESLYDDLGFRWISVTPRQIEHDWPRVRRIIRRKLAEGPPRSRTRATTSQFRSTTPALTSTTPTTATQIPA